MEMVRCSKVSYVLKIEISARVKGLMNFVKSCCNMEGYGELAFLVADHLHKTHEICLDGHELPRMTSVSRLVLDALQFVQVS